MESLLPLILILTLSGLFGIRYRSRQGVIRKAKRLQITQKELGQKYGKKLSIVQFSTTFCSACRAAKAIVKDVTKDLAEISYIELDAESNLELVRKVDVRSTPTTIFLDENGFEVARASGAPKRDQLIKVINSF